MRITKTFCCALAVTTLLALNACTKSTDTTSTDLVGNWVRGSDFDGNARSEAVTFTIGDKVYLTTGTSSTQRYNDLWEYDPTLKYWTRKADFPGAARNSAVAFTINGKAYVGTGYDGTNRLSDFYQYDPATGTWTAIAALPASARYDAAGFSVGDKGYVCAGFDGNYLKDLWEYDPATNTWTQRASLSGSKRSAASAFVINGKAYVCSGNNNGSALEDLWCYDPATGAWTQKRNVTNTSDDTYDDAYTSIARYNGVALVLDGKAYLSGGENGSLLSATWEYDPSTDLWTEKTAFEGSPRTGAVGFTVNNKTFVLTGRNGSLSYDNMYEFRPSEEYNSKD